MCQCFNLQQQSHTFPSGGYRKARVSVHGGDDLDQDDGGEGDDDDDGGCSANGFLFSSPFTTPSFIKV